MFCSLAIQFGPPRDEAFDFGQHLRRFPITCSDQPCIAEQDAGQESQGNSACNAGRETHAGNKRVPDKPARQDYPSNANLRLSTIGQTTCELNDSPKSQPRVIPFSAKARSTASA